MNWTIFNFRFRREQDQTEGSSRTSFKVGIGKLTVKPPKATSRLFPAKGVHFFRLLSPYPPNYLRAIAQDTVENIKVCGPWLRAVPWAAKS